MSRWKTLYRYPSTGIPLFLVQESPTGLVFKSPLVSNFDHMMVTKGPKGVGKHLTDETVKEGEGRHESLGKLTAANFPTELLDSLSVEVRDDEPIYIPDPSRIPKDQPIEKKDLPGRDLVPPEGLMTFLETADLDTIPVLRKVTWGEARRLSCPGGIRREGGELVYLVPRRSGKVVRLPLSALKQHLPVVAEVSGVGPLFDRAKRRLPDSSGEEGAPER